jgi:hypothetical protein
MVLMVGDFNEDPTDYTDELTALTLSDERASFHSYLNQISF